MFKTLTDRRPRNNRGARRKKQVREHLDHEASLTLIKGEGGGRRFGGPDCSITLRKSQQGPKARNICNVEYYIGHSLSGPRMVLLWHECCDRSKGMQQLPGIYPLAANCLFFFLSIFILRETARVSASGKRGRERETIPRRFHAVCTEPDMGL